jgi:hypothetical protein
MPQIKLYKITDSATSINPAAELASEKREIETQRVGSRLKLNIKDNIDIDAIMARSAIVSQEDIETHVGNPDT